MASVYESVEDEKAPSYEESIRSANSHLPLHLRLQETRTQRIQSVLSAYVDPLLESQGSSGLYKTTFLLLPSNTPLSQSSTGREEVMGFPADENVRVVRLQGEEHHLEFWRQPAVVAELETSLKAKLFNSGHRIAGEKIADEKTVENNRPKTSFWKQGKGKSSKNAASEPVIVDRKLGWRPPGEEEQAMLLPGFVRVTVAWKTITLRVVNKMGLFDTRTGPGLYVGVEVGS